MSPLLAILRLCSDEKLTQRELSDLIGIAVRWAAKKNTVAVRSPRRTVLKPVKVAATSFMRNGKRVTRKAHVRCKPDRRK